MLQDFQSYTGLPLFMFVMISGMATNAQTKKFRARVPWVVVLVRCMQVDDVGYFLMRLYKRILFDTAMLTAPASAFLAVLRQLFPAGRVAFAIASYHDY